MGVRENKVEKYLDEEVVKLGGITRKWTSVNRVGVPDRIVVVNGVVWFVEVKTTDGRLSPEQKREHIRLIEAGANVDVVKGRNGVYEFMKRFQC